MTDLFIGADIFADAAGIGVRCAQKALARVDAGATWRGCRLQIRKIHGTGGRAGTCYQVALASLPTDIQERVRPPIQTELALPLIVVSSADKTWKRSLIQAVMAAGSAGSSARAAALRNMAGAATYPTGKRKGQPIPERTLRAWIAAYEAKGATALQRSRRSDKGKARTVAWRASDRLMAEGGVTAERQEVVKTKIVLDIKTLLLSGAGTVSNVNMLAQTVLREIVLAELPGLLRADLDKACRIPAGFIRQFYRVRLAHQKRTDAKGHHDKVKCRVRRHRHDLVPMQIVAMDVRHSDIMYRRADGTLATAKMIVCEDLANNRMFARVFLMQQGNMIRREHVLMFMRDMFCDPSWGIPQSIYLDNGTEFMTGDAVEELTKIASFVREAKAIETGVFDAGQLRKTGVMRALPYNGQSKTIEGMFSNWSRSIEPPSKGYVGGNRQVKKVENQGREKEPMPGDENTIKANYAIMADYYNAKRQQRGHVASRSPNDAFVQQLKDGWQSIVCLPEEFTLAFGKNEHRQVQTGGEFQFKGQLYRHDDLAIRVGERILIRVPILDAGGRIPVLDGKGNVLCVAARVPTFGMQDLEGAREGGRRNGVLNAQLRRETEGVPVVDLLPRMQNAVAGLAPPPVPTPLATVSVHPAMRDAAQAIASDGLSSTAEQSARRARNAQKFADMQRIAESGRAA